MMKKQLYRKLFEIRTVTDPVTGKPKREAVYIGPYYRYQGLPATLGRMKTYLVPGAVVFTGVFIGYLFTDLPSTRYYLTLPFALAQLLPLFYWVLAVVRVLRMPERFTQWQRDAGPLSYIRCAYGLAALGLLFAAGEAVLIATGGAGARWPEEAAWGAGMAAAAGLALWSARRAKALDAAGETITDCSAAGPHDNK